MELSLPLIFAMDAFFGCFRTASTGLLTLGEIGIEMGKIIFHDVLRKLMCLF